jgi:hypothetical protein
MFAQGSDVRIPLGGRLSRFPSFAVLHRSAKLSSS